MERIRVRSDGSINKEEKCAKPDQNTFSSATTT